MKKTNLLSRISSLLLCIVLIAAMALSLGACAADDAKNPDVKESERPQQVQQDENIVGEGDISFKFIVVDADGKETEFTVKTDADTVGKALLDANLIAGEDSEYGLYVKTVNGITAVARRKIAITAPSESFESPVRMPASQRAIKPAAVCLVFPNFMFAVS